MNSGSTLQSNDRAIIEEYLSYNPETGEIRWIKSPHGCIKVGQIAGNIESSGYRVIMLAGRTYKAHRLAFLLMTGVWPDKIDHINQKRDDNRWCNLRSVDSKQNGTNRKVSTNNTSGVVGVAWHKTKHKWSASIRVNGRIKHLGDFGNLEEAAIARRNAELFYYDEYAPEPNKILPQLT
jgi:hypothetical protein